MATYTENYNLIKPDEEDYYDVADFNENMDTLDSAMAAAEAAAEEVSAKIGTPAESGQTVFSSHSVGFTEKKGGQYRKVVSGRLYFACETNNVTYG